MMRQTASGRRESCLSTMPAKQCPSSTRRQGEVNAGADLRGDPGRQQLHLCRSACQPIPARLDWGPCAGRWPFLGGVPEVLVPDNLKAGVKSPAPVRTRHQSDLPGIRPSLRRGGGAGPVAAKPKDKAKVEVGVQVVERWILARLRDRTFFSLAELNQAICGFAAGTQRAADAPSGPIATGAVCRIGPAGPAAAAATAL